MKSKWDKTNDTQWTIKIPIEEKNDIWTNILMKEWNGYQKKNQLKVKLVNYVKKEY